MPVSFFSLKKEIAILVLLNFVFSLLNPLGSIVYAVGGPEVSITYSANPAGIGDMTITAVYSEPLNGSGVSISIDQPGSVDIVDAPMTNLGTGSIYTYIYTVQASTGSGYIDGTGTVTLSGAVTLASGTPVETVTGNQFLIQAIPSIASAGEVNVIPGTDFPSQQSRIYNDSNQFIGTFGIQAVNENMRIQNIELVNIGTATLENIATGAQLYDSSNDIYIPATATISGNTITFSNISNVINADTIHNYIVMVNASFNETHYGQTIALSLPTLTVVEDASGAPIVPVVTAYPVPTYTLNHLPPSITSIGSPILQQDKYLAKFSIQNNDSNTGIYLTGITVQFSYRYQGAGTAPSFTGSLCLRDEGSTNTCGSVSSTTGVVATDAGLTTKFTRTDLMNLTNAPTLIDKNGQTATFEVYLDNAPLWTTGDNVSVSVRSLDYTVGSIDSNESYIGVTGASATMTKDGGGDTPSTPDTTRPSVTINTVSGEVNPTVIGAPIRYTATFSEPIDKSTFTKGVLSTSGSTATGVVVNSISEVSPFDGTTFEISVSASGTGKVVLSIPQGTGAVSSIFGTTGGNPTVIKMDKSGNIYVLNSYNSTISKITPSGVSSILGTGGTIGADIVLDTIGNVYIANYGSNNVSKITPSGVSSVFANIGKSPYVITIDNSGNIYTGNSDSTITKITPSGVSSILGTGGTTINGIAIDGSGNVYTANYGSDNVSKITPSGVSSILGTTGVYPQGIAIDGSGNIYTSNGGNANISKITPTGISTFLGNTNSQASSPIFDSAGNILVTTMGNDTIYKITPSGETTILEKTASGTAPTALILDNSGYIYTANYLSNNVTKITPPGISDLAGNYNLTSTSTHNEVTIGSIAVADTTRPSVTINTVSGEANPTVIGAPIRYTATFSEPIDKSSFTKGVLSTSGSTASGTMVNSITEIAPFDGTTFEMSVSANGTGKVVLSIPDGSLPNSSVLGLTGIHPEDILVDKFGNIYTADAESDTVSKITPDGVSSILGTTGRYPYSITIDGSGNIYTANNYSDTVTKITPSGISSILGAPGNGPAGIIIDKYGNIYTTNSYSSTPDGNSNSVTKITPSGISSILGTTGTQPHGITIDGSGNIYTANQVSDTVSKITPEGISTILGTTGKWPGGITIDGSGNIYTANFVGDNVTKITPDGVSTIFGTTGIGPTDLTIDGSGNIYTANNYGRTVSRITPSGISSILGITGDNPHGITIDGSGNIYTANYDDNSVTKITPHGITDLSGNYNLASTGITIDIVLATPITSCSEITTPGNYVLSNDLVTGSGGSCIDIHDTSNITLDCQDHTITDTIGYNGDIHGYTYGIKVKNVNNFKINNCKLSSNIRTSNSDVFTGIIGIEDSQHGELYNSIVTGTNLINMTGSTYINIHNNSIGSSLEIRDSNNITIQENNFIVDDSDTLIKAGIIILSNGHNNSIINNIIDGKNGDVVDMSTGVDDGILTHNESQLTIQGNTIKNVWDCGIEPVGYLNDSQIIGNTILNTSYCAIGGWYGLSMRGNSIRNNVGDNVPSLFMFQRLQSLELYNQDYVYFIDNTFENNKLMNEKLIYADHQVSVVDMSAEFSGIDPSKFVLGNNVFKDNDFTSTTTGSLLKISPQSMVVDGGGNTCPVTYDHDFQAITPLKCDKSPNIAPLATIISYTTTSTTTGNVIATITPSKSVTFTNTGGSAHTFTANGSFTFTFIDSTGNTGSTIATVGNIDTSPIVTVSGEATISGEVGIINYHEEGAHWTDNEDGSGFIPFATSGSIDINVPGTYVLEYSYTDTNGNTSTGTRVVKILPPVNLLNRVVTVSGESTGTMRVTLDNSLYFPKIILSNNSGFFDGIKTFGTENLPYAEVLADNGVISGEVDVSGYRLDEFITRAEFAKIAGNIGGYVPTTCAGDVYGDVDADLGDLCGYIEALAEAGVVSTANPTYNPTLNLTRGEALKMILSAIGEYTSATNAGYIDNTPNLGDVSGYINRANELRCISNGSYAYPNSAITRGNAFQITTCLTGLGMRLDSSSPYTREFTGSSISQNVYDILLKKLNPNETYYYYVSTCISEGNCTKKSEIASFTNTIIPLKVTINVSTGQLDPTTASPIFYRAIFSEPIDKSTFLNGTISTSGSTASGIVINSITEVTPNNGTTFDISVSTIGTGKVVLSIPEGTGSISSILGTTGGGPFGITIDPQGNIYTSNNFSSTISKITPGGVSSIIGHTGNQPLSITIDPQGNIYTVNAGEDTVTKTTPGGVSSVFGHTGNTPYGITIDPQGNIYTANTGDDTVTKITPSGVSSVFGHTGNQPRSITIDPQGNIYTANAGDDTVTKITPSGVSSVFGHTGNQPASIAIDPQGNIYTGNAGDSNVTKITPSGVSSIFGTSGCGTYGITIDPQGNIYTSNYCINSVYKITPGGVSSIFGTSGNDSFGIILDPQGNIYTSNRQNNTVSKITPEGIKTLSGNVYNSASTSSDNEVIIGATIIADTTLPIITLSGSTSVNVELGSSWTDSGASWTDNIDGNGRIARYNSGTLNTGVIGTYIVSYHYTDRAGNRGTGVTRTIHVVDTTPPVITLSGSSNISVDAHVYRIQGSVYGGTGNILINGLSGGTITGVLIGNSFSVLVPLYQNTVNSITVSAKDASGNTGTSLMTITENSTIDDFRSPINATGGMLSGMTLISGSGITSTTGIVLQVPIMFSSGTATATIPSGTRITNNSGTSFDATTISLLPIIVTGGLLTGEVSNGALEFGIQNVGLQFDKPIRIEIPVPGYIGTTIKIKVRHEGSTVFGSGGLTNDPNTTCTGGIASSPSDIATVSAGIATIYTCAASTFVGVSIPSTTTPYFSSIGGGGPSVYFTIPNTASGMELGIVALRRILNTSILNRAIITPFMNTMRRNILEVNGIENSPARGKILALNQNGYIKNIAFFRPEGKMKRFEFIKIIALVGGYSDDFPSNIHFTDIKRGSAAENYIAFAVENGWVSDNDPVFRPNETITLGEAQEILSAMNAEFIEKSDVVNGGQKITREVGATMIVDQLEIE